EIDEERRRWRDTRGEVGEDLLHDGDRCIVNEVRHDRILQEGALDDDRLRAACAALGESVPLTGVVHSRIAGRSGAAQEVDGSRADRVIVCTLLEGADLYSSVRQPRGEALGRRRFAGTDHAFDQDEPSRSIHRTTMAAMPAARIAPVATITGR